MVDYTTSKSGSGSGIAIFLGAAAVLLVILYAIYAGGDTAAVGVDAPAAVEQVAPESTTILE